MPAQSHPNSAVIDCEAWGWLRWRSEHVALGKWLQVLAERTFGSSKEVQKCFLSRLFKNMSESSIC